VGHAGFSKGIGGEAMTQQSQFMLMFSLGPVQTFILQARKTRDLWIGSFLLSKLMEAAMERIDDNAFVFPGTKAEERRIKADIPDLPNKYVALFASAENAEKAAHQSEEQIEKKWKDICDDVRGRLLANYYTAEVQTIWERQTGVRQSETSVHQFFEIYWVVVPDPGQGYGSWLEETTLALDARKRLHDFLPQDEPGEKSTISGEREVLHGEDTSREDVRAFWRRLTANERHTKKDIHKDGSERLDAIDSIKRFALYSPHLKPGLDQIVYPSTSSIATARFVGKLLDSNGTDEQLKNWRQLTEDDLALEYPNALPYLKNRAGAKEWILKRDGDCFFPEAFTPRYLKENYRLTTRPEEKQKEPGLGVKPEAFITECLDALNGVYQAAGTHPTPYYALVQMDGDHMGTIMSGVSDDKKHKNVSGALSIFAREHVPQIVQTGYPGRLVYAGGDDVLALTPLDGMLAMIDRLQRKYKGTVMPVVPEEQKQHVTASMGIAIAHHFTPLSVVRRAALEAEKLAKNLYGRNAFVVTLLRRSGEQTRVGCRWEYPSLTFTPVKLFQDFYSYFLHDIFSPKSIHVLLDEVPALIGLERAAQRSEIKRVLKRQFKEHLNTEQQKLLLGQTDQSQNKQQVVEGKEMLITGKIAELADQIVALAEAMDQESATKQAKEQEHHLSVELRDDTLRYGLVETLGWLLVMAFLAREGLEA